MTKDNGGPAFPTEPRGPVHGRLYDGMTLRDWFAGQALAGLLAANEVQNDEKFDGMSEHKVAAMVAYTLADAMLEARK